MILQIIVVKRYEFNNDKKVFCHAINDTYT